ncbi:MAG: hypothetical protein ACRBFS_20890 [Aureispira sp.]
MNDKLFKSDAKSIVDILFEGKAFKDHITRDDMNLIEDHVHYMLSSRFKSYVKGLELQQRIDAVEN